jgi:uncharacterized protein YvpB
MFYLVLGVFLAVTRNVNAAEITKPNYSSPVGSKVKITVNIPDDSQAVSSNDTIATVKKTANEIEVDCINIGTAFITVADNVFNITVTERAPAILDTSKCTAVLGSSYDFIVTTNCDDISNPIPESSDFSIAKVEFSKKIATGKYLYKVDALKTGTAMVGVNIGNTDSTFKIEIKDKANIKVSPLLQKPELTSGCEVTALTNLLNFYGYNVSKTYMADRMLIKDDSVVYKNGKKYMANPAQVFVGDPRSPGYGCYSQPIVNAANKYLKSVNSKMNAYNISGSSTTSLYDYVANNIPVLVWGTINMDNPTFNTKWYDKSTGKLIQWIGKEHCLVLIGFDNTTVTISDPIRGIASCSKSLFEKRYSQLNKQAVMIK